MIKLSHIVKTYDSPAGPVHALKDISLEIARGEIFGIIGLSGAGKSTLIRCINMLERPTSGTVEVDGRDLTAMDGRELRAVRAFKTGLAPIVIALLMATGWLLTAAHDQPARDWPLWLLTAATTVLVWRTRLHLLWLIGAGAVAGMLGWV